MAKNDKKNVDTTQTTELSVQVVKQPEGSGGEQLPPLSDVLQTGAAGNIGTATGDGSQQQIDPGNAVQAPGPLLVGDQTVNAPGAAIQQESAAVVDKPVLAPKSVRVTDQTNDTVVNAPGAAMQPESAAVVEQPEFIPQPVRVTVQAVAVPNKRRMRAGHLFTEEPQTFVRDDFTDEQWEEIDNDPHLKIRRLED